MDDDTDIYEVLGVPEDADREAINQAYRERATEAHPEAGEEGDTEQFERLQTAREQALDALEDDHDEDTGGYDANDEAAEQGVFADVVGHKGAKAIIRNSLREGDVHVMMEGPPASGKSTFLMAIEQNVPGTVYRDGERVTATRVQSVLKEDPPILLIDEFDSLGADAYNVLSNPMEHGRLTEDTDDETYDIDVGTQIIVSCNNSAHIPDNIRSRFRKVPFERYDEDQLIDVCGVMLPPQVEWVEDEDMAKEAARVALEHLSTDDPREIRDLAQISNSAEQMRDMAAATKSADADVDSEPLSKDEIKRAKVDVGREKLADKVAAESDNMTREEIDAEIEAAVEERMGELDE